MHYFADLTAVEAALRPFFPRNLPQRYAYTTDHIRDFMDFLGNPQDAIPAVHIAGTSGKTSTAYYAAGLLQAAGNRVGLMISPHLEALNERTQINLAPLAERQFCDEFAQFMELVDQSRLTLTFAELLYAFAFWEFVRQQVDYMVIETGMGGLLDATNVMTRPDKVCIITDIGLDHTNVLGASLEEITAHKAGIIQPGNAVFCYRQTPAVIEVIEQACRKQQADLTLLVPPAQSPWPFLPLFQQRNLWLARAAVRHVLHRQGLPLTAAAVRQAARLPIPGRMEVYRLGDKTLIFDSAHNAQKLGALGQSLAAQFPGQPIAALLAFIEGRGRDLQTTLQGITPYVAHVITTSPEPDEVHNWHSADNIAAAFRRTGKASVEAIPDFAKALDALQNRPEPLLLITGSIYMHQHLPYR